MNLEYKVYCVHIDLEKNVECNHIETNVSYLSDDSVMVFQCPVCKREVVTKLKFPEATVEEVDMEVKQH